MGSLGWPEILIILVVALIIFGPRKLPELGKTLGESLAQFRRASEDFKRTWEAEVEYEKTRVETPKLADTTYSYSQESNTAESATTPPPEPPVTAAAVDGSQTDDTPPPVDGSQTHDTPPPVPAGEPAATQPAVSQAAPAHTRQDWM